MKTVQLNLALLRGHMKHGLMTTVANKLNMHPNTLSRKLRGDRSMTIDELNAIARALRIGVDEFIDFEDEPDEPLEDDNPLSIARFEEAAAEVRQRYDAAGYTESDIPKIIAKVRSQMRKERANASKEA